MEELFEFLFGASGRINWAKYWRSLLIFCSAGLLVGVILLTAAGLAAPLFILMLTIVFIPWLLWGIAFHTERLHDRGKKRMVAAGVLCRAGSAGPAGERCMFAGAAGTRLHCVLALAGFALSIWGFVEIGCLRGNAGPNKYGSNPLSVHAARGRLFRRQSRGPAKIIVEACRLHRHNGSQHKDDLHQGSGRENLVQQRHVMLRCRRIGYRNVRYNRSLHAILMNDARRATPEKSNCPKTKKARWPFGHRAVGSWRYAAEMPAGPVQTLRSFSRWNKAIWMGPKTQ